MSRKRVKAGTSKSASEERRIVFSKAYVANGRNETQAAIEAGFSAKTAYQQGHRLLKDVRVIELIEAEAEKHRALAAEIGNVTVERVLKELGRLAFSDPRKLLRPDGTLIPIHELDDDTAATIASFEVTTVAGAGNPADADDDEEFEKRKDNQVVMRTHKLKTWDKNTALANAMRHLGMFEKDNAQRGDNIALKVELVG